MSKKTSNKITLTDSFQIWAHKWGRVGTLIALIYMVAVPFVVLSFYDSIPTIKDVINVSTISILMVYIPVGFSEAISYTPILGASSYLTFITGNIMNLKLPCAINAMKLAKKEANTPEGEAIASVAVSVCSIMTIIITVLSLITRITTGSSLFGMVGFLILFMLPVAIISSRIMWKKNIIKVVDKEENE